MTKAGSKPEAKRKRIFATTMDEVRAEYVNGIMSLRELAVKHGRSASSLMKVAARDGWEAQRKRASIQVAAKAIEHDVRSRASDLAEFNEADLRVARALRGLVVRRLNKAAEDKATILPAELDRLAAVAEKAQRMGRLALGVSTSNHGLGGENGQGPVPVTAVPLDAYIAARKQVLEDF